MLIEDGIETTLWQTSTVHDSLGQVVATIDRLGNVSETKYDTRGQVIETRRQVHDEDGTVKVLVTRTVYDEAGRPHVSTDAFVENSLETVWGTRTFYDNVGRTKRVERLKGVEISIPDTPPLLESELVSAGTIVWFSTTDYDNAGRPIVQTDRFGAQTRSTYNDAGLLVETRTQVKDETTALVWRVTRTVYDELGRAVVSTDPFLISGDGLETILTPVIFATDTVYDELGRRRQRGGCARWTSPWSDARRC